MLVIVSGRRNPYRGIRVVDCSFSRFNFFFVAVKNKVLTLEQVNEVHDTFEIIVVVM